MKTCLSLLIISLVSTLSAFAQKTAAPKTSPSVAQQFIVKKQQLVDDLELQMREIQSPVVHVYIRYRLADWLWKNPGGDDTGRAEGLAVKALEEAFTKKDDFVSSHRYKLVTDIFELLDKNAKETSARLKTKYDIEADADLFSGFSQLTKPDGDRAVAQKLLKALTKPGPIEVTFNPLLNSLRMMRSPQYLIVAEALMNVLETGPNQDNSRLMMYSMHYNDPQTPPALKKRYFTLVVNRARGALQRPDQWIYHALRSAIIQFGPTFPELVPEAEALKNVLAREETTNERARREAQERIDAATDKIAALIEEAEKTDVKDFKASYYMQAVYIAQSSGKFALAVDIIDKVKELNKSEFGGGWVDQQYANVARRAFEKNEIEIAIEATERIADPFDQAEGWKVAADHFSGRNDHEGVSNMVGKALRLLASPREEAREAVRVGLLLRFLPLVEKSDKLGLPDALLTTTRAINDLPTPGPEIRPGAREYSAYISRTYSVNSTLATITRVLVDKNRSAATDLAERIQKKEFRIVADLVVAIDALETARKEAEKKASEIAKPKGPAAPVKRP